MIKIVAVTISPIIDLPIVVLVSSWYIQGPTADDLRGRGQIEEGRMEASQVGAFASMGNSRLGAVAGLCSRGCVRVRAWLLRTGTNSHLRMTRCQSVPAGSHHFRWPEKPGSPATTF